MANVFMEDDSRCISTIRAIVVRVMQLLGADAEDFRLRDKLIVAAAPLLAKHEAELTSLREQLSVAKLAEQTALSCHESAERVLAEERKKLAEAERAYKHRMNTLAAELGAVRELRDSTESRLTAIALLARDALLAQAFPLKGDEPSNVLNDIAKLAKGEK